PAHAAWWRSAHRVIPRRGCFPAEPASVSPGAISWSILKTPCCSSPTRLLVMLQSALLLIVAALASRPASVFVPCWSARQDGKCRDPCCALPTVHPEPFFLSCRLLSSGPAVCIRQRNNARLSRVQLSRDNTYL